MKHPLIRGFAFTGLALLGGGLLSSCRTSAPSEIERKSVRLGPVASHMTRIGQSDFGRHARYPSCLPQDCPVPTPKTLATGQDVAEPTSWPVSTNAPKPPGVARTPALDDAQPLPTSPATVTSASPSTLSARRVAVRFAFGSAELTAGAQALIDAAATLTHTQRIVVQGRTDNVGPRIANQRLARLRAEAVRRHLRKNHPHLAAAQVALDAQGACCFTTPNITQAGRAANRRVEIVFVQDQ